MLYFSLCKVRISFLFLFCLYTLFPSVVLVFHGKNLVFLNLIKTFLNSKDKLFNQRNTYSYCEGGVNIYLYGCTSLLAPLCVCVCIISDYQLKTMSSMSVLTKLDALWYETHRGRMAGCRERDKKYRRSL